MHDFFRWAGKWWPGLVPLAVLWVAAAWNNTVPLETALTARATAALEGTALAKTVVTASGRDITLSAQAFSPEGAQSAAVAVAAVPGVRLVNDETRLVPEVKPFVWSAERDVVRVTLGGSAPLPALKSRLLDAARDAVKGTEVADQMTLARGASPHFDAAALLLIDQIGKLKEGKITLSDSSVSLAGMARELGGREAIAAALKNLPEGYVVAENAIKAPPYIFQANKDPVAVAVTVSGYVPDNNVHTALIAATGRKFFDETVIDQLKASVGAPSGFANAATVALGALSRLSTGSLVMADREVRLSGDAFYGIAADQIRASLATGLPQGWKATADISVRPPASMVDASVCQQLFADLFRKGSIRFETGRATIDPDSQGLLDRLVEIALRCPAPPIEIAGHTDSAGDDAANRQLSEKRAQAVVDYLVKAGLPLGRLSAVGYGSTKPIASNDTDEGRAQNRRIEFVVKE
jgi:OmpA-OmpF porin, OOP family